MNIEIADSNQELPGSAEPPVESLADLMPPEQAERYLRFLENGSMEGLTDAEIAAIRKVDEALALKKVDGQSVLELRRPVTTGTSKTLQTGERQIDYNAYIERLETIDMELDSEMKRFDPDPEIADAWYRLTNGTYNQNDISLLNHEYFESKFESFYKTDYRTAHNKTEESGRIWDPYKENN